MLLTFKGFPHTKEYRCGQIAVGAGETFEVEEKEGERIMCDFEGFFDRMIRPPSVPVTVEVKADSAPDDFDVQAMIALNRDPLIAKIKTGVLDSVLNELAAAEEIRADGKRVSVIEALRRRQKNLGG